MNISKEDLLSIVYTQSKQLCIEKNFQKHYPEHYQEILKINFPEDFKFSQKLFHYLHNDPELRLGICPTCGKRCHFKRFSSGYHNHCSKECSNGDIERQIKRTQTCMEKYGVTHYAKTNEFKEKSENTCLEKYGVTNYNKTEESKERHKQTWLNKCGVICNFQLEETKNKIMETCQKRFGVKNPSQCELIKKKKLLTCQEKHNVDYYCTTDEFKEKSKSTCLSNFGVENPSQSEDIKQKKINTCLKNHGVEYYTQSHEYHKNHRKQIPYKDLTFDSSWEVEIFKFCEEHNIPCEYQPNIQFTYEYNGKEHIYQPDFLINGKVYEVKGDHFFDEDGKMINPYNRSQDEIYESKHQCMIQNGVIILTKEDIENLSNIIKNQPN